MRVSLLLVLLISEVMGAGQPPVSPVLIDGRLNDGFWSAARFFELDPAAPGVPQTGGQIAARIAGRYLYLGARFPDTGPYTARSIGVNPRWEEEDRALFVIRVSNENDWRLTVGPLGAYSVEWRWTGEAEWYTAPREKRGHFLVASTAQQAGWSVEAAIPLANLGSPAAGAVYVSAERIRAARQGVPELKWRWPSGVPMAAAPGIPDSATGQPDPLYQPPVSGNREPPVEAARVERVPPPNSAWTDAPWSHAAVWRLTRDEPQARVPEFSTEVKLLHDGETLSVLARCSEPGETDTFELYLAISGSAYVRYGISASGSFEQAYGFSGGPRISRPRADWSSPARGAARRGRGEWIARLDLPLGFVAEVLGEAPGAREWRILLLRSRGGQSGEPPEISVLPIIESVTPLCPARYRRLSLLEAGARQPLGSAVPVPKTNLAFAPARVFSASERANLNLSAMLDTSTRHRVLEVLRSEARDWENVQSLEQWEGFRDRRIRALAQMIGKFPHEPLEVRVVKEFLGEGYRRQDIVYRTRPAFWATANLYLPADPKGRVPAIVIAHSLHGPKTQFELQDMGILWARAGCAVLVMDQAGYGERREGHPWDREAYHSRYVTGMQLDLVGESLIKWMVWDLMRGIDLLVARKDVDAEKIVLLGAVAGGGDPAAVTAALDRRVAAVAPFNFGESTPEIPRFVPEKNQWPLELADPGLYDWDTTRCLRRGIVDQFLQWTICASVAPRRFVYSYELGWNVEDLPAWARYQRVFGFYRARENLAEAHGFGPFPGPGECWNIGPAQRRSLYPALERWFGIPTPFDWTKSTPRANLQREPVDRRPEEELAVLDAAAASQLGMRSLHDLARAAGEEKLGRARSMIEGMSAHDRREWMRKELKKRLGDIEPNRRPASGVKWTKRLPGAEVEAISLAVEPDIVVPVLLFRPDRRGETRLPVVLALAEGGKDLFVQTRANEIEALLKAGVAVCLPDVRGTGETTPDSRRDPDSQEAMLAVVEQMLGETLAGRRLKDLRTVLAYLESRADLDSKRIALWGESLAPSNPAQSVIDELPQWQVGPVIHHQGEPLGGLLALLGALYEPGIRAVAVSGGLASYLSILDDSFAYVPADVTIPGFLEVGDLADVAGALAPLPMFLAGAVDGKDRVIPQDRIGLVLRPLTDAYRESAPALTVRTERRELEIANWLAKQL